MPSAEAASTGHPGAPRGCSAAGAWFASPFQQSPLQALSKATKDRKKALADWDKEWQALTQFAEKVSSAPDEAGTTIAELMSRAVALREQLPELSPVERERLPNYACWANQREEIASFLEALTDIEPKGILANHPFRLIGPALAKESQPIGELTEFLDQSLSKLDEIAAGLNQAGVEQSELETWSDLLALFAFLPRLSGQTVPRTG
jgi:hypothetical protein